MGHRPFLYDHFRNKEEIIRALFEQLFALIAVGAALLIRPSAMAPVARRVAAGQ